MIKYRIQISNRLNEDYVIYLNDKSYTGDFIDLIGTGEVLKGSSINNDDDRFSPIISKEIVIGLWIPPTQNVSITDFIATEDDQWRVIVHREKEAPPIFDGFLVVEDSSQPLYDRPYPLMLRASDGIPLVKNVSLQRSNGDDFTGKNNVTDYIGHILYYINPEIPFRIYYDIFHKNMSTSICSFEQIQLEALTFEQNETTFLDCYTVLETIMKDLGCRLMYENGYWAIVGIGQYKNPGFSWHEYKVINDEVVHQDSSTSEPLIAKIGKNEVIQAINKDAQIFFKQHFKSVKEVFTYKIPKEIICNQQLLRGDKIPTISGQVTFNPDHSIKTYGYQGFELECWEHYKNGFLSSVPATKQAYIKREFDTFNYEKDRYIVLQTESNNSFSTHLRSSRFAVGQSDKVDISVDVRHKNNYNQTQVAFVFYVLLTGDNGELYSLQAPNIGESEGKWFKSTGTFATAQVIKVDYSGDHKDKTEWRTVSVNSAAIPVTGTIQIILAEDSFDGYPNETWYKNIQIDYRPYIKESYRDVTADYNIYSQDKKINRTIEETVNISDSPKPIIRGSLFVNDLLATPEWFRLGRTESLRFRQLQTLIKYNFHFRQFQKVEGTLKGLSLFNASDTNIPFGFLPQYSLSDIPNSPKYILTSITDCNYLEGQWRGVIVEIPAEEPDFDTYDFQYVFK